MVAPTLRRIDKLTGRVSFRNGWFGRQIAVVEVESRFYRNVPAMPGWKGTAEEWREKHNFSYSTLSWRDAEVDDFRGRTAALS